MKKIILILIFTLTFSGCELYVIGTKQEKPIDIDQNSSIGVVYMFKTELDSNNLRGASQVLAPEVGDYYLAIERYDMFEEINRIQRIIAEKPITSFMTDTLSEYAHNIVVHFDYLTEVNFTTKKISNNWYITDYSERINYY